RHMAFVRSTASLDESALVVAGPDGGGERVLARRRVPAAFLVFANGLPPPQNRPAWSPDGSKIALLGGDGPVAQVVVVDAASGSERAFNVPVASSSGSVAWLDKGSILYGGNAPKTTLRQLWRLSYPGGETSRVTNDLSDYLGVSMTADAT